MGVPGLTFRKAREEESNLIASLTNAAYRTSPHGWTTEADLINGNRTDHVEILSLMRKPDSLMLVCLQDVEIIGSLNLQRADT